MPHKNIIRVGVGVMIFKNGKVLMGKRKTDKIDHGDGEYAWPGGHLEYGESIIECAKREVMEECGLEIKNVRFLRLMNMIGSSKHYVDIALICDWKSGEPLLREPDKCEGWNCYDTENLPSPLFEPIPSYIEALLTERTLFD